MSTCVCNDRVQSSIAEKKGYKLGADPRHHIGDVERYSTISHATSNPALLLYHSISSG